MKTKLVLNPLHQDASTTLNPFASAEEFLRSTCAEGLSADDCREVEDQIEALVPALVQLRDGGHIELNARTLVNFGSLDGFSQLAGDKRLTDLNRQRCEAIRVRLVVQGVKVLLGHQ